MGLRANCVALLLSSLPVAGCGTVKNTVLAHPEEGGKTPFGGVRQDMWCIQKAANGEMGARPHQSDPEHSPQVALALLCAADLPFSFVGDVVTWPYTKAYSFINRPVPYPPVTLANPPVTQPVSVPPATLPMPLPVPPGSQPLPLPVPLPVPPVSQLPLLPVPPAAQGRPTSLPPGPPPAAVGPPRTAP